MPKATVRPYLWGLAACGNAPGTRPTAKAELAQLPAEEVAWSFSWLA